GGLPRRQLGSAAGGAEVRLQLATPLRAGGAEAAAGRDGDPLRGRLRQLRRQPGQPRPEPDGPGGQAGLGGDVQRLLRVGAGRRGPDAATVPGGGLPQVAQSSRSPRLPYSFPVRSGCPSLLAVAAPALAPPSEDLLNWVYPTSWQAAVHRLRG